MGKCIALVAAIGPKGELGLGNQLIYRDKADMNKFVELTKFKTVLMGRKTWESLPAKHKPLSDRLNLVASRLRGCTIESHYAGCESRTFIAPSLEAYVLANANSVFGNKIMIIGGGEIYNQTIGLATDLYISHFFESKEADTFFPTIDLSKWAIVESQEFEHFRFRHYVKIA